MAQRYGLILPDRNCEGILIANHGRGIYLCGASRSLSYPIPLCESHAAIREAQGYVDAIDVAWNHLTRI